MDFGTFLAIAGALALSIWFIKVLNKIDKRYFKVRVRTWALTF